MILGRQNQRKSSVWDEGRSSRNIVNIGFIEVGTFFIEIYANPFWGVFGPPFGLHFGSILEALGTLLAPMGAPGTFWRGLKTRSKKEVLPSHTRVIGKGGVPIRIVLNLKD